MKSEPLELIKQRQRLKTAEREQEEREEELRRAERVKVFTPLLEVYKAAADRPTGDFFVMSERSLNERVFRRHLYDILVDPLESLKLSFASPQGKEEHIFTVEQSAAGPRIAYKMFPHNNPNIIDADRAIVKLIDEVILKRILPIEDDA